MRSLGALVKARAVGMTQLDPSAMEEVILSGAAFQAERRISKQTKLWV